MPNKRQNQYLKQLWTSFMTPYDTTRSQWINLVTVQLLGNFCLNWLYKHHVPCEYLLSRTWIHTMMSRHDDVIKWKLFPRYWPFVRGIHRSLVNSPHKGQWRGALMFSLIWRLSKQSWGWWFETQSCQLWRYCNGTYSSEQVPCKVEQKHVHKDC